MLTKQELENIKKAIKLIENNKKHFSCCAMQLFNLRDKYYKFYKPKTKIKGGCWYFKDGEVLDDKTIRLMLMELFYFANGGK